MSEPIESAGYHHRMASEEVLAQREHLVERICVELRRAGLPVYRYPPDSFSPPGAEVSIDRTRDDSGGGVFVQWSTSPELTRAVAGLPEGDLDDDTLYEAVKSLPGADDPAVRHHEVIVRHMQATIIGILCSAGLHAYDPVDSEAPDLVKVDPL
jgi:hypothetical protein